jgi:hypothetical protein
MKKTLLVTATLFIGLTSFAENNTETTTTVSTVNIEKEAAASATELNTEAAEEYYYERRFSAITEMGTTFARTQPYFNIYQAIGVRVNPHFFIGQGFGLQVSNNKLLQIQATADMRAYALDKKVTPMFTVQAGLNKVSNSPVDEKKKLNDTQFIMNAGTGILIKARENASFTINGGYTLFTDFKNKINGGFVKVGYVF